MWDAERMGATISEATERNKLNYDQVFFGLKTQFTEEKWIIVMILFQLFWLSFWRHPFTAEDPLLSKWCDAIIL